MGLLEWFTRSARETLDREVHGAQGEAHAPYPDLVDGAPLRVKAQIGNGHRGTLVLRARPGPPTTDAGAGKAPEEERAEAQDELAVDLGPGERYRGGALTIEARVDATSEALAVLAVEVSQPDPARAAAPPLTFQTFSVESRFDADHQARLRVNVALADGFRLKP